jgi:plasmid replication initiation protein
MNLTQRIEQLRKKAESKTQNKNKDQENDIRENSVTKSNALVRSYYNLSLNEKRLMESLISKLDPRRSDNNGWDEKNQIEIKAIEFSNLFNMDKKIAYSQIKTATKKLLKQVITVDEDNEAFPLMAKAKYHDHEGRVTAQFNPWLIPHLQLLKGHFTSYPLKHAAEFTSGYTWRLYEILMSWRRPKEETGGVIAGWINIKVDEIRKQLSVPNTYNYNMFNSQVLLHAKEEIQNKAGILIEIERTKTGRKITDLRIEFIEKSAVNKEDAA